MKNTKKSLFKKGNLSVEKKSFASIFLLFFVSLMWGGGAHKVCTIVEEDCKEVVKIFQREVGGWCYLTCV